MCHNPEYHNLHYVSRENLKSHTLWFVIVLQLWDNITVDLKETGREGMDWVLLARDRARWEGFVNTVVDMRVAQMADIFN